MLIITSVAIPKLPKGTRWVPCGAENSPFYTWMANGFPNLILEAPVVDPFGKTWVVEIRELMGKNHERTEKYSLKLRIRLKEEVKSDSATHTMTFIYDSGKFAHVRGFGLEYVAIFSNPPYAWLIMAISPVNATVQPY